jgi:hypothetical protein
MEGKEAPMASHAHLAVVRMPRPTEPQEVPPTTPGHPDGSELALVAALFALNLVPVLGELLRLGHWSPGIVGFATAAALLTGRELWSQLRARAAAKTDRKGEP